MHIAEGDDVKVGTVLFHDKKNEGIFFTSPVSGKVKAIVRGEKRVILQVVVESDGKYEAIDFGKAEAAKLTRNEVIEKMVQSGTWTMLRQRPYSTIANPQDEPKCPSPFSALPPLNSYPTLVLKLFRGEPAISKFVWNFTASIYQNSDSFFIMLSQGPV